MIGKIANIKLNGTEYHIELTSLQIHSFSDGAKTSVSMRCPYCGQQGTFDPIRPLSWQHRIEHFGVNLTQSGRVCPNENCQRLVFTISNEQKLLFSFPSETLDFDSSGVPPIVSGALSEAISCHASDCFRAAAIMVRRTLEEVCAERGATGRDLKARIKSLAELITLPKALLDAMDELRLLGNDAAHIEAKTYESVGTAEVEAGIALAKEVVKATYQYEDLLAKLRGLSNRP